MTYFITPDLSDVALQREFSNVLTDKISSNPKRNGKRVKLASMIEREWLKIDHEMKVREFSFRSHMHIAPYGNNDTGYFRFYEGNGKPVVVIPPRGGYYRYNFARMTASYLASNGFDVYEVVTPFHEKRLPDGVTSVVHMEIDADVLKLTARQSVEEVLGLIRYIGKDVGVVGLSQGAVYGSIVSSLDEQVKSTVLIHGFGDLASFLRHSDERLAKHFRECVGSINEGLLREELRNIDPLTYATPEKAATTLMINSKKDNQVPEQNIVALWNALGNPRIERYWGGHKLIALRSKGILKKVTAHLKSTLD